MSNHQDATKELEDVLSHVVRREKVVINLSAENCNCIGGKYYLGLAPALQDQVIKVVMDVHKMFASEELARQFLNNVPPPSGKGNFVIMAPLAEMSDEPPLWYLSVTLNKRIKS